MAQKKRSAPPPEGLAEEQRRARIVGALALLAGVVGFAAVIVQLSALDPNTSGRAEEFANYDDSPELAIAGTALRVLTVLLLIPIAMFLYEAIRLREPTAPSYVKQLGIGAPIVIALVTILGYFTVADVVDQFFDLPVGERDDDRAEELNDDSTLARIQGIATIISGVAFAGLIAVMAAGGMGVGLFPRFVTYFGYGVAALTILDQVLASPLLVGFIISIGLLMVDRWPGGRPLAWESGRAEPPP